MKYKPVPLPQKNVIINDHNKKKTPYVYHLGKGFRNDKNQPTCKQTSRGCRFKLHVTYVVNSPYKIVNNYNILLKHHIRYMFTKRGNIPFSRFKCFYRNVKDIISSVDDILRWTF